jgi:hypothetical protein
MDSECFFECVEVAADEYVQDIFTTPLASQKWADKEVSYHFMPIRDVAPYLAVWRFNRAVDEAHKDKIKAALVNNKSSPHLMGTIQVMRDRKKNCRIMNGQHRIIAALQVLHDDINMEFDMKFMFEVYDVPCDDLNMFILNKDIDELFKLANTSLAVKQEDDHDIFCKQIVIEMGQDKVLSKGLVDKPEGNVWKPRVLVKEMFELFKTHLPHNHGLTTVEIVKRMKQLNVKLSLMSDADLFGRNTPAKHKQNQRKRAHNIGFFLNLDSNFSPNVWIPALTSNN